MAEDEEQPDPVDETPNAADPLSQERQKRRFKQREDRRADFWRRCLADPDGRMVLWDFFIDCGVFEQRFAASPAGFPVSEGTWFHLGQKDVGERLYKTLLKHDRLAICQMHDEHDPAFAKPKPQRSMKAEDA